jgi:hypothetical protein
LFSGSQAWSVICFPKRRKAIALRFRASRKPGGNPWLPVERMRSTLGGFGRNFPISHGSEKKQAIHFAVRCARWNSINR